MFALPHTAEYALRAALQLATVYPAALPVGELAERVDAPANYLAKTLHQLARAGILGSARGPSGGFHLARPPERLTIGEIAAVFSSTGPRRCLLGHGICGEQPACSVHAAWKHHAVGIDQFFAETTLAALVPPPDSSSTSLPGAGVAGARPR